jgi:hypothetical protein
MSEDGTESLVRYRDASNASIKIRGSSICAIRAPAAVCRLQRSKIEDILLFLEGSRTRSIVSQQRALA